MKSTTKIPGLFAAATLMVAGCAETVPKELKDARAAYTSAKNGPAQEYAPSDLHEAEQALKRAELTFNEDGNEAKTRDRAYIAGRKARIAEVHARTAQSEKEAQASRKKINEVEQRALNEMQGARSELVEERQRREAAEQRAQKAMAELGRIAQVNQDNRGTVITLPGGVLFESGKSDVRQAGEGKLVQVAEALTRADPSTHIVVEGHTDSQGSEQNNMRLSEKRAESVRGFLISHGVPSDRVTATGYGESRPVASNDNPEGRANNRRVEIIVQQSGGAQSQQGGQGSQMMGPGTNQKSMGQPGAGGTQQRGTPPSQTQTP